MLALYAPGRNPVIEGYAVAEVYPQQLNFLDPRKRCTRCGESLPRDAFYRRKATGAPLPTCKPCTRAIRKAQYHADPEAARAAARAWHDAHREEVNAKQRYRACREAEKRKLYRESRREVDRPRKALWQRLRTNRQRANGGELRAEEWTATLTRYGSCCLRCGRTEHITIDHVVPVFTGGRNDAQNVQPLCASCNAGKKHYHATDYRLSAFARMKARDAISVRSGKCLEYVDAAIARRLESRRRRRRSTP